MPKAKRRSARTKREKHKTQAKTVANTNKRHQDDDSECNYSDDEQFFDDCDEYEPPTKKYKTKKRETKRMKYTECSEYKAQTKAADKRL